MKVVCDVSKAGGDPSDFASILKEGEWFSVRCIF